jgi:hypothetical protein
MTCQKFSFGGTRGGQQQQQQMMCVKANERFFLGELSPMAAGRFTSAVDVGA